MSPIDAYDDDLTRFEAEGPWPLPAPDDEGHVDADGARVWYANDDGSGAPVVLLHGGLGNAGNWGYQVPALRGAGRRVVVIDGTKPFESTPLVERCLGRHRADYALLSETTEGFDALVEAVGHMQRTQPNLSRLELARIEVPVTVVHAEHDEFIRAEHAAYLAEALPNAELVRLDGVSHFAPVQRPAAFDRTVAAFLDR
jgi:pimeloyl-ACP methyl ester carboxylesterase